MEERFEKLDDEKIYGETKEAEKEKPQFLKPISLFSGFLILILILFFFVKSPFEKEKSFGEEIVLIGDINNFSKNFSQDLSVYSSDYFLKTRQGNFKGKKRSFNFLNFSGEVYVENSSLIVDGKTEKIVFGENTLSLNGEEIKLISTQKSELHLKNTSFNNLDFLKGSLKFGKDIHFKLEESNISLKLNLILKNHLKR